VDCKNPSEGGAPGVNQLCNRSHGKRLTDVEREVNRGLSGRKRARNAHISMTGRGKRTRGEDKTESNPTRRRGEREYQQGISLGRTELTLRLDSGLNRGRKYLSKKLQATTSRMTWGRARYMGGGETYLKGDSDSTTAQIQHVYSSSGQGVTEAFHWQKDFGIKASRGARSQTG